MRCIEGREAKCDKAINTQKQEQLRDALTYAVMMSNKFSRKKRKEKKKNTMLFICYCLNPLKTNICWGSLKRKDKNQTWVVVSKQMATHLRVVII